MESLLRSYKDILFSSFVGLTTNQNLSYSLFTGNTIYQSQTSVNGGGIYTKSVKSLNNP
jgi:hypothetical protein